MGVLEMSTKTQWREEFLVDVTRAGCSLPMAREILRHARLLQRWSEEECGNSDSHSSWAREDCEVCGGSHVRIYPYTSGRPYLRAGERCEDDRTRFSGKRAQERIAVIAGMFGAVAEFSGDPRGCVVKLHVQGREIGVPS